MSEVPAAGKHHCHIVLVRRVDHLVVPDRTTGLDGRPGTAQGGFNKSVCEREEGVGGYHGTVQRKFRFPALHHGDLGCVDAAHLTRPDAQSATISCVDDRVALDVLHDAPGEIQISPFFFGRRAPRRHAQTVAQVATGGQGFVSGLHEDAPDDAADLRGEIFTGAGQGADDAAAFLLLQELHHADFELGRDDDLGKDLVDGLGRSPIERDIHDDDSAERRFAIR